LTGRPLAGYDARARDITAAARYKERHEMEQGTASAEARAATAAAPFVRRASGVVRAMSPADGAFYGYLSAAGIYIYVFWLFVAAATFPRANFLVAGLAAFAIFMFVFAVYALLASSMPRSGGDYVFVSRILSPRVGFFTTLACWSLFNFFGCYFAATALVNVVLSPLFSLIGVETGNHFWVDLANDVTKPGVRLPLIIATMLLAGYIMASGMAVYVKLQKYVLMPAAILGLLVIVASLLLSSRSSFMAHFDQFQATVGGLKADEVIPRATALGFEPGNGHSVAQTFGVIAAFSPILLNTMWSVELMGEIKGAGRTKSMFRMFMGSHTMMLVTILVGFVWTYHFVGEQFMKAFSWMTLNHPDVLGGGWDFRGVPTFFYLPSLNIVVGILVFIGFAGPISQSLYNTILGPSRMLLAASFDRMLPEAFSKVNRKGVPHVAIWFGVSLSVIWAVAVELNGSILSIFFWGAFMAVLALTITVISGALLPYTRRAIYEVSPASRYRILGLPAITVCGTIGALALAGIALELLVNRDGFGLLNTGPARTGMITCIVATVACFVGFELISRYRASQGILVRHAFEEIPPA
jgi:APA family basic amino acid/polyamine antiporter